MFFAFLFRYKYNKYVFNFGGNMKYMNDYNGKGTDLIIDFLAIFNQIDKYFDKILELDNYLPFNEKLKRLINGNYTISWFIHLHKYQLKFLGELRNNLTHGLKLDGHNYSQPTIYALKKIKALAEKIITPPNCRSIFKKNVYSINNNNLLKDVLTTIKKYNYKYIPVYDDKNIFLGIFEEGDICSLLSQKLQENININLKNIKISDINFKNNIKKYLFISEKTNIYKIDEIFTIKKQKKETLNAIFITENGNINEKIIGIITSSDIPIIDTYIVH